MIPDYQTLMLPLLRTISDGQIHSIKDTIDSLAKEFKLTEEDLNEWLPSKKKLKKIL
jgi:restriction system protein